MPITPKNKKRPDSNSCVWLNAFIELSIHNERLVAGNGSTPLDLAICST